MRTPILLLLPLLLGATPRSQDAAAAQDREAVDGCMRAFAARFADAKADLADVVRLARERVWDTYEWPATRRHALYDWLRTADDGPAKVLAALAIVGYHDPAGALALLDAAADPKNGAATRDWCLQAAPCVLGMGDVWLASDDPAERARYAARLRELAKAAQGTSIGRVHAGTLRSLAAEQATRPEAERGAFEMALWHASAYLIGTLDLASRDELAGMLDALGAAATNVLYALALCSGQPFLRPLRRDPARSAAERDAALAAAQQAAKEWWLANGDVVAAMAPRERLLAALAPAGVDPEAPCSAASKQALAKAFEAEEPWTKFAAYRLLDELAGTHYDLDFVLLLDKYGLHPLQRGLRQREQEQTLRTRALAKLAALEAPVEPRPK